MRAVKTRLQQTEQFLDTHTLRRLRLSQTQRMTNALKIRFLQLIQHAFPALLLALAASCFAQNSTGTIHVFVTDKAASVVTGADVQVTGTDTGAILRQIKTSPQGIVNIPLVPPGQYNIDINMDGFKTVHRNAVNVQVGATVSLDIVLEVGAQTETITVTGETPLTETKSQTVQQVIEQKEVADLPLNGRNYLQAANFIPGVVPSAAGRDNSFVAYGNSGLQNAFLLDGARNVNYMRGLDNGQRDMVRPPLDALAEFTVQTSNYSAEFGASAGALVNAITRSGTNKIHGSAYEFTRNSEGDAKSYFANTSAKGLLVRNQYGGSFGGPVFKDRLFYFGAYEGVNNRSDGYNRTQVPTALERSGDFSQSLNSSSALIKVYDPATTAASGSTYTRTQFSGNAIPAGRINSVGKTLANLYPLPNLTVSNVNYYQSNVPSLQSTKNGIGRMDYTISRKDTLFARYAQSSANTYSGVGLPGAQDPGNTTIVSKAVGLGYTRIFSENLVNNLRFAWTTIAYQGAGVMARNEVITGLLDTAITAGMPNISVQNFGGIGSEAVSNSPLSKTSGVFDIADNWIWTRSKHMLAFGGEWMWIRPNTQAALGGRGSLGFSGVFTQLPTSRSATGEGLADMLLGFANSVSTGTTLRSEERGQYFAGYVNDQWTMSPNFTLNMGVRYEFQTPFIDTQNRMANFVMDPGPLYMQFIPAGDSRLPRGLMTADTTNFSPRVGFAYKAPFAKDLTIRSSFGIFFAQDQGLGITSRLSKNPPFYNYGSISLSSDQLYTSTGFELNSATVIPRPTPVSASDFTLLPTFTGGITSWPTHFRNGRVQQWSLSVQKKLPWETLFEVNYVGNHGVHLIAREEGNQPKVLNSTTVQSRRPLSSVTQSSINRIGQWNATQYQGMSAKIEKRFAQGISFRNSLTYGHAFDLIGTALDVCDSCGNGDTMQNTYDHASNWGPADIDVRLRYTLTGNFELPFGHNKPFLATSRLASATLGGWNFSPIYLWQTGAPLTAGMNTDTANSGTLTRPNQVCDPNVGGKHDRTQWFNTACLVAPANYTFGNMRVGTIKGPGQNRLDLSVQRNFPVPYWEGSNLNVRLEGFNTFNHAQWSSPNATVGSSTYGQITSAGTQRQLQAAVRLTF